MDEATSCRRCPSCGTGGNYATDIKLCPLCGGCLETEYTIADDYRVELSISFAAVQCPTCGMTTLLQRNRQCTGCGVEFSDEVRSQGNGAVKRRRDVFKGRIQRLRQRLDSSGILQPIFTREGQEISLADYINTIGPALDTVLALSDNVRKKLRATTWDTQDLTCLSNFQEIVSSLDQAITQVMSMINQLPPLEVRAVHRILARATTQIIHGYITFIEMLIIPNPDEVLEWQREGQRLFTLGARTLEPLSRIINRVSKQAPPGWWMSGDTLNLAMVAWEGVENTPVTIDQAANMVRVALTMIPGVKELDDAHALFLLPTIVLPVTFADPSLLQQRAGLIHTMLIGADSIVPGWIQDANELVLRIGEGLRAVNEQVERLGFAATGPNSRRMAIQLLADVYVKLVEGPLRDLGSVVVIAARAIRGESNGIYISKAARGVQAGDIVQELERLGSVWQDAVYMLMRNAGAHGGIRVLDAGVALTQRKIENGLVVDEKTIEMSDAQFAEEFARLNETCLALQLGIAPWIFTHSSESLLQARQAVLPTQRECEAVVCLLAGLQGLLQVAVERHDNTLYVRAVAAQGVDASSPQITYLVPAIFHNWTDVDAVTLHISSRPPVTYERAELADVDPLSGNLDRVAVGLMGRRWLGDLPNDAAIVADITYLVRPQIITMCEAFKYASMLPVSVAHIAEAHAQLIVLTNRQHHAQLPRPSTALVAEVLEAACDASRCLHRLLWAFVGTNTSERQRQVRSCAALVNQLGDIERRAIDEFNRKKMSIS